MIKLRTTTENKSSCSQVFFKTGILKNFTDFSEKHLIWSLFLKETLTQVFSCENCKNFRRVAASRKIKKKICSKIIISKAKYFRWKTGSLSLFPQFSLYDFKIFQSFKISSSDFMKNFNQNQLLKILLAPNKLHLAKQWFLAKTAVRERLYREWMG